MALAPGTRLGSYTITAAIGAGGMGEVYRAIDTRLKRDVALKILPEPFATDPDRLARFQREAEVLASLNHPNIAHLYGLEQADGVQALVMELVEGPTLADQIANGPIPIDEALPIAKQIAEALEAAHEQGIIHRDLKPANIKVRPDGTVKVLDFGLAKLTERSPTTAGPTALTNSPTITSPALMTGVGALLGTAAYMSPEQAKGRPADNRSDIWAFGCVFYEILTGQRAFLGDDVTETIAAVVRAEPDWHALPPGTPAAVRRLLTRCLQKHHRDRLPHIGAARLDINEALASSSDTISGRSVAPKSPSSGRLAWTAALALTVAVAFGTVAYWRSSPPLQNVYRSTIFPLTNSIGDAGSHLSLSPNGRNLAFVAPDANGRVMLWVRPLDGVLAQPLAGTEGAAAPFWSPDSRRLAFVAEGKLKTIDAVGGRVVVLGDSATGLAGAWNQDDVILFTPTPSSPLFRVSATGGTPSPVTTIDSAKGPIVHAFPSFLPDGRHFLYLSQSPNGSARGLEVGSLDSKDRKRLKEGASNAIFVHGHVMFLRETTLMVQAFDTTRLEFAGEEMPLVGSVQQLGSIGTGGATFAASQTGVLVYRTGSPARAQLTWFDRTGQQLGLLTDPGPYGNLWLSPDGQQAGVEVSAPGENMRIWDVKRGVSTRMTSDASDTTYPVWSPDSTRVVFTSRRKGHLDLYEKAAAGAIGSETELWSDDLDKFPTSWSSDGLFVLYTAANPNTDADVWILPLGGDSHSASSRGSDNRDEQKPRPLIQTRFAERAAQFSPDGRWIAYQSHESGQPEVFVTRFPSVGATVRVSPGGGMSPQWHSNGRELFFLAPDGSMTAAEVASDGIRFEVGRTRALFRVRTVRQTSYAWDVSSDGQRFLVNVPGDQTGEALIALIVNWPALIDRIGR